MIRHVTADPGTRRLDGGRVVIGGAPLRLFRLTPAGAARLDSWLDGAPVSERSGDQGLVRRLLSAGVVHPRPDPVGPGRTPDVTLVVPIRDRPERLARVLEDTAEAVGAVIVVDDGSPDGAGIEKVARQWGATVLRNASALGPAAARNRGWRAAGTELVLFVDSDCRDPAPAAGGRWLARLVSQLADPDVGIVAPRVVAPRTVTAGSSSDALSAYERERSPLDQGPSPARVHPGGRVRYVPAATLLARRAVLEALGGFDESMRVGEDVDLVWRADAAGTVVRYDPSVTITHEVRPDLRSWLVQRYRYGTSAAELDRRHPGSVAPAVVPWPVALTWTAAVAGRAGAAAGVTALNFVRARRLFATLDPRPTGFGSEAGRLALQAHLGGGRFLADAARRAWWPVLIPASFTRFGRRTALAAVLPLIWEALASGAKDGGAPTGSRQPRAAARWLLLRLADDLAYGAGAWAGALRVRRLGALLPRLTK